MERSSLRVSILYFDWDKAEYSTYWMREEGHTRKDFDDIKNQCKEFFAGDVIKKMENTIVEIEKIDLDVSPHEYWNNLVYLSIINLINYSYLVVLTRNDKGEEKGLSPNDILYIKSNENSCFLSNILKKQLLNDLYIINRKVGRFDPTIDFTKEGSIHLLKEAIKFYYLCLDARKAYYSLAYLCITIHNGNFDIKTILSRILDNK